MRHVAGRSNLLASLLEMILSNLVFRSVDGGFTDVRRMLGDGS